DFHGPRVLGVKGRKPQAAIRLLDRIEFVALLEIEPCKQLFRQDHANRIANLANLKGSVLKLVIARGFTYAARACVHGTLRYPECITHLMRPFNKCFTAEPRGSD